MGIDELVDGGVMRWVDDARFGAQRWYAGIAKQSWRTTCPVAQSLLLQVSDYCVPGD